MKPSHRVLLWMAFNFVALVLLWTTLQPAGDSCVNNSNPNFVGVIISNNAAELLPEFSGFVFWSTSAVEREKNVVAYGKREWINQHNLKLWKDRSNVTRLLRDPKSVLHRRYARCAAVGSSGTIRGRGYGGEIDGHDLVLRFNNAPLSDDTAKDTGTKTTLMFLSTTAFIKDISVNGIRTIPDTAFVLTSIDALFKVNATLLTKVMHTNVPLLVLHDDIRTLSRLSFDGQSSTKRIHSGVFGITMLRTLCDSISIFGFSLSAEDLHGPRHHAYHYYDRRGPDLKYDALDDQGRWLLRLKSLYPEQVRIVSPTDGKR